MVRLQPCCRHIARPAHRRVNRSDAVTVRSIDVTGRTITAWLVILAATVAATTQSHAHSSGCTPQHLQSALKQVETQCGEAKVVSGYRRGATIRGTRRASQHSFCNGTNGAIDAVFSNRACALAALRKTNYTVLTYGSSSHIHIGTDGRSSAGTRVAHRQSTRVRAAAGSGCVQQRGVRVAHRQRPDAPNHSAGWNWSE